MLLLRKTTGYLGVRRTLRAQLFIRERNKREKTTEDCAGGAKRKDLWKKRTQKGLEECPSVFLKKKKTPEDCADGAMKEIAKKRKNRQKCGTPLVLKDSE